MTIDDKIGGEKLQYNIKRKAANVSKLSSGKVDEYEYHTREEILLYYQSGIITEQAKFTFNKALEKRKKIIEDQGIKQVEALKDSKTEK